MTADEDAPDSTGPLLPPGKDTQTLAELRTQPAPERRVGPYKLIRELGQGGMGTVYLAARADEEYHKRVAIKVIKAGRDSEEVVRYFRRERQILASLDHPHIARLLDGGATEEGLPYFVMEYIEGQPIHEYCDRHSLSIAERLKLFRGVCSAVQYAHRNLIVHRDIKPSNVLVTADGVPRLLDFGIAKLLNPELAGHVAETVTAMVMTPEYASPEQVRGEPITTATDVYSLGVVLYELLTGHQPYRITSRQPLDILRAVLEEEPGKPSTAIGRTEAVSATDPRSSVTVSRTRDGTPERLRRRLQGDLDNILMMALRKEPHRRYPSVEAFSEDIRRHLEGLPVTARKATVGYRAVKFIRRNRIAVASTAAVFALVIGFAISVAIQAKRVERERDKAERVSAFLVDLFKVSDPSEARGNTVTAREMLDKGAAKIEAELKDQPEVRATLMDTMGRVYDNLGLYDKATALLQEALRTRRQVLGSEHPDVARSLNTLAIVLRDKGDYAGAEALLREALAMRRKLLGSEHPDVARSLNNLAIVLRDKGDYAGAEALYREALAMWRKLLGNEHPGVAGSLSNLAVVLHDKGDYAGAEALHREALAMLRKLLGSEHPDVATSLNNLAIVLRNKGDSAGAEALYRETLAMRRRLLGNEHPDVAASLYNLATALYHQADYTGAEALYREALAMMRKLLGSEHPWVAASLSSLANVLCGKGDYAVAEPLHREALAMRRKLLGSEHPDLAESLIGVADALRGQDKLGEAEVLYRQAVDLSRRARPRGHPSLASPLVSLAALLTGTKRSEEAEPLVLEALDIRRKALPTGHPDIAEAESALGDCLTASHRYDEAEPLLLGSYPILKAKRGERSSQAREALERIVRLYETWGKPAKAAEYRGLLAKTSSLREGPP